MEPELLGSQEPAKEENHPSKPAIEGGVKEYFVRPNVFVCPSGKLNETSIGGSLYVLEKENETLLQWLSFSTVLKSGNLTLSTSFLDMGTGEAIKPPSEIASPISSRAKETSADSYEITIPLKAIHSIKRSIPSLPGSGYPFIIICTDKGVHFPPLYFQQGGIKELFKVLKEHSYMIRSEEDSNLFFFNADDDLSKSISSMDQAPASGVVAAAERMLPAGDSFFTNFTMSLLGKFSQVPKTARRAIRSLTDDKKKRDDDVMKPNSILYSLGEFELVDGENDEHSPLELPQVNREAPLTAAEWTAAFDPEGRIPEPEKLKARIFKGGVEPDLRREVWKFLLGYFPWNSTSSERQALREAKSKEYYIYKSQWQSITPEQEKHFGKFRSRKGRVEKDVARTDRDIPEFKDRDGPGLKALYDILITYVMFNFDVGYVQGMNDLLSPIWLVMQDEVDSFWCFKCHMDTMAANFDKDQNGMNEQFNQLEKLLRAVDPSFHGYLLATRSLNMFFCYRWLLVNFKREFSMEATERLWEVLWTNHIHPRFHLFVVIAVLALVRNDIMSQSMQFDQILRVVNDLSGKMNIDEILKTAEALYMTYDVRTDEEVKASIFSVQQPRKARLTDSR